MGQVYTSQINPLTALKLGTINTPILQMHKSKHREVKWFAQGHTARWDRKD